jgi:hypothetical protein
MPTPESKISVLQSTDGGTMSNQTLTDCPKCRRHYFLERGACPFCAKPVDSRYVRAAMTMLTPMVLGACYGSPKDTGYGGWDSNDTSGTTSLGVGAISGTYGLSIQDSCDIAWAMSGTPSNGVDLRWDVSLTGASTDCDGVEDTTGSFELMAGGAYFAEKYIGAAVYTGGSASWATDGYINGTEGGSYYYAGSATY